MRKTVVRRPKKRAVKKRTPLAKLVKQIVMKQEETKFTTTTYSFTNFNSAINAVGDNIPVLPPLLNGTSQSGRIGSAVKPLKLVIRGYIAYKTDAYQGARMLGTRLFCYSDKSVSSYTVATSAGPNYRLLDVGGTTSNFTGSAMDYILPHNTDAFRWYADKKHTIMKPFGLTNTLSPTATGDITSMDKTMFRPFTIVIKGSKLPANLIYDDSLSTNQPVNFAPYLAVGYCDLLNYLPDTATTQIGMEWTSTLYYKDA